MAFEVRLPGLQRDAVGVEIGVALQAELQGVLDRDEALGRRDVCRHGSKQRGLSSPVPPQMTHDFFAAISARKNSRSTTSTVPVGIRSSRVTRR